MAPGEEEARFGGYPRYRGSARHHAPPTVYPGHAHPTLPTHPAHASHSAHAAHSPHSRVPPDEDALYETADAERLRDAPDSERYVLLIFSFADNFEISPTRL